MAMYGGGLSSGGATPATPATPGFGTPAADRMLDEMAEEELMMKTMATKKELREQLGSQWPKKDKEMQRFLVQHVLDRTLLRCARRDASALATACALPSLCHIAQKEQNRDEQLRRFLQYTEFLDSINTLEDYRIYIIEQTDDGRKFNRGKLLNIGYEIARESCNVFMMHDVDMLPHLSKEKDNDLRPFYGTLPPCPLHVAWACEDISGKGPPYAAYVGGILALSGEQMERTNGFPNNYWGWGGEDDELRRRSEEAGLELLRPSIGAITDTEKECLDDAVASERQPAAPNSSA